MLLMAGGAGSAWAAVRQDAMIVGTVRSAATDDALPHATLVLDGTWVTTTNSSGSFGFPGVAAGSHTLPIRSIGHRPVTMLVVVPPGRRLVGLTPRLEALPFRLAPIEVVADRGRARLLREGFYERQELGFGHFVTRADIERHDPRRISFFLNRLSRRFRRSCTLWIDGIPAETLGNVVQAVDLLLKPETVAGLEIYGGGATTPIRFAGRGGSCTVIAWTR